MVIISSKTIFFNQIDIYNSRNKNTSDHWNHMLLTFPSEQSLIWKPQVRNLTAANKGYQNLKYIFCYSFAWNFSWRNECLVNVAWRNVSLTHCISFCTDQSRFLIRNRVPYSIYTKYLTFIQGRGIQSRTSGYTE